jgi:hypothetical protein
MHSLTGGQIQALRNLADKRTGNVTAFLNIADARALVEIGFASRSRQGWDITEEGAAHLATLEPAPQEACSVEALHPGAAPEGQD